MLQKWYEYKKQKEQEQQQAPNENKEISKIAKESMNYENRTVLVNSFEQKPITKTFDFNVSQKQQQQKQLKRTADFLTAKDRMDARQQIKKHKQE